MAPWLRDELVTTPSSGASTWLPSGAKMSWAWWVPPGRSASCQSTNHTRSPQVWPWLPCGRSAPSESGWPSPGRSGSREHLKGREGVSAQRAHRHGCWRERAESLEEARRAIGSQEAKREAQTPAKFDPSAKRAGYHHRLTPYGSQAEERAAIAQLYRPLDPVALIGEPDPPPTRTVRRRSKRDTEKRWRAKLGRRIKRQRDRWSAKLGQQGWHCPNPRVVTAPMWEATQLAMGEERHAPRALLSELPVGLAEAFIRVCWAEGVDLLTDRTYRRHLGALVFLWEGSRRVKRPGFLRGTFGYSRGLIGACLPKPGTWGDGYKLTAAKESITWLVRAGLMHRHQPPHREYFEVRGMPDPLPNWARGPSGQAYNEYWFPAELVRGPQGPSHRRGGLRGFSDEVRDWLLEVDSEAERAECEREARADLKESAETATNPSRPSGFERETPIQGDSEGSQGPDSPARWSLRRRGREAPGRVAAEVPVAARPV